jgi:hypothetical protein
MSVNTENEEMDDIKEEQPIIKPKAKKERSEKQLEQFEMVKERRRINIEKKVEQKKLEALKLMLRNEILEEEKIKREPVKKVKPEKQYESSSSSSSEEKIIIKRKPKVVKKKKNRL